MTLLSRVHFANDVVRINWNSLLLTEQLKAHWWELIVSNWKKGSVMGQLDGLYLKMSKWPFTECQRDSNLDHNLKGESIKYSWTPKGRGGAPGSRCMQRLCASPFTCHGLWNIRMRVPDYRAHTVYVGWHAIKPHSKHWVEAASC